MKDYEVRSSEMWDEARFAIEGDGSGFTMEGPMALFEVPSRTLSIADLDTRSASQLMATGSRTFREIIHHGAFTKTLREQPDIVLHYQHDERSLPLGRTKAGTLRLTEEAGQVRAQADLPDNEWGRPVRDAVLRKDIGGISFRMGKVLAKLSPRETLADGYTGPVRHVQEVQLKREISLVTFPGYDTPAMVRELAEAADLEPDQLAEAFAVLRNPDAKLTDEQHNLLQTAIATKVDAPFINPHLAHLRERLGPEPAALAG